MPHFKKDLQLEKVNYRPVTVLSAVSKIFEHVLHQQLADHSENIFHKYLFGYRKYHGCPTALQSPLLNNGRKILTNTISSA